MDYGLYLNEQGVHKPLRIDIRRVRPFIADLSGSTEARIDFNSARGVVLERPQNISATSKVMTSIGKVSASLLASKLGKWTRFRWG